MTENREPFRHRNVKLSQAQNALRRSLLSWICLLTVGVLICAVGVSRAWYIVNRDVDADNANITTDEASTSLFLRQGEAGGDFLCAISTAWNSARPLYPISTVDCQNWYYISGWEEEKTTTVNVTSSVFYGSAYTQASVDATGQYTGFGSAVRQAYYHNSYTLYTDKDALDIYLHPETPIVVAYNGSKGLDDAIRVGLAVGGTLKFVYAPTAETNASRNYISAAKEKPAAGSYYGVNGTQSAAVVGVKVGTSGLSDYLAEAVNAYQFTAGTTSLGTATAAGTTVDVYVWLEGMDADAVTNVSDNDGPLSVSINFVGAESAPAT